MTPNTSLADYASAYQSLSTTFSLDLNAIKNISTQPIASLIHANGYAVVSSGSGSGGGGGSNNIGTYVYNAAPNTTTNNGWGKPFESVNEKINKRLDAIEHRLCVLQPNFEKHEKFAALKRAYDHYKVVEALCIEQQET